VNSEKKSSSGEIANHKRRRGSFSLLQKKEVKAHKRKRGKVSHNFVRSKQEKP
jgi:hypothetical protein